MFAGLLAGKPDVPTFQAIDPQAEQAKAVAGNVAQIPALEKLAGSFTQFNQGQIEQMLQASIPGYTSIKSDVTGNIEAMLKGEIPADVQQQIQRQEAATAVAGGFGGTGMQSARTARDLGLTSLQLTQQGLSSAESWINRMNSLYAPGVVSPMQFSNMFLSPAQQISAKTEERNAQFQHDWAKNILDWQSSLGYLAGQDMAQTSGQFNQAMGSVVGEVGGAAAGSAVGGGGL